VPDVPRLERSQGRQATIPPGGLAVCGRMQQHPRSVFVGGSKTSPRRRRSRRQPSLPVL